MSLSGRDSLRAKAQRSCLAFYPSRLAAIRSFPFCTEQVATLGTTEQGVGVDRQKGTKPALRELILQ